MENDGTITIPTAIEYDDKENNPASENILPESDDANVIQPDEDTFKESQHWIKPSPNDGVTSRPMPVSNDGNKPSNVSLPVGDRCSGI